MGGDGAFSVPLREAGRVWLFGDTWVGLEGGRLGMVSNTVGVQGGPCEGPFQAYWGTVGGQAQPFFLSGKDKEWLWPAGGLLVDGHLYLFLHRMARRPPGGAWDFRAMRTELLRIRNPRAPPASWLVERAALPWDGDALLMGLSPVVEGAYLLLFGTRAAQDGRELILARTPLEDLRTLAVDRWEFLTGSALEPGWAGDPQRARGLFQGVGTEFTVGREPAGGAWVCLYSPRGISPEIHLRRAPLPQGPWGGPEVLFRCPEAAQPDLYCYGAKLHPECAEGDPGGLWVTYTVNTRDARLPAGDLAKPRWMWIRGSGQGSR